MKEKIVKIVSVLTAVVLFTGILCTPVSAISTSCVQHHFSMLTFNPNTEDVVDDDEIRTPPSENTCPYVAMSMLLTFYDSYWNDRFVDDRYEWDAGTYDSSTDTLTETFAATTEAQDWEELDPDNLAEGEEAVYDNYREYAVANEENFLEPYLIFFGMLLGFHPETDEYLGLTDAETVAVLEYYLFTVRGFLNSEIEVHYLYEDDGDIEAVMRDQINNGFPVIYIGKKIDSDSSINTENEGTKKSGHELIAYGIDEDDNIMLHTGWKYDSFTTLNDVEYNLNRAIIWIEIKDLPHECSNAYRNSENTQTYCACEIYCGTHRNGKHTAISGYDYADVSGHHKSCARCGEANVSVESHNAYYNHIPCNNNNYHRGVCSLCGYETTYSHIVEQVSGKIGRCILCGASVIMGNQTIMPWGYVGGTVDTSAVNDGKQYITENGSYVLPNGVIIISNIDYSLYLSGELDIYELIDGGCCTE